MAETRINRPLPPPPTGGRPCSYGDGTAAEGWRWVKATREWVPVCHGHNGSTRAVRAGDYVPDIARVPRADAVSKEQTGGGRG